MISFQNFDLSVVIQSAGARLKLAVCTGNVTTYWFTGSRLKAKSANCALELYFACEDVRLCCCRDLKGAVLS